MAPSSAPIPQRFRQPSTQTQMDSKNQKHWNDMLNRRKKCKERYQNIKKELDSATESLEKLNSHSKNSISNIEEKMRKNNVFHIGPNSFIKEEHSSPMNTSTYSTRLQQNITSSNNLSSNINSTGMYILINNNKSLLIRYDFLSNNT